MTGKSDKPEMGSITSIVALGLDGAIGCHGDLPWKLRSDLRFFKRTTTNNIVIMGRKTYESIGHCLPNRENIVLSHRATLFEPHKGCCHAHGIGETLFIREKWPRKQTFLIGGAQTFSEFAPFVDRYLLTFVNAEFPEADTFLEEDLLEPEEDWIREEVVIERFDDPMADEFDFKVIELRHRYPERMQLARQRALEGYIQSNHLLQKKAMRRRGNQGSHLGETLSLI